MQLAMLHMERVPQKIKSVSGGTIIPPPHGPSIAITNIDKKVG